MDRRQFVKFLAATAAASALPEQVAAFEQYFEINTPRIPTGLVAVDEVFMAGAATRSMVLEANARRNEIQLLNLGFNGFGGIIRWVAAPMQTLMVPAKDFILDIKPRGLLDGDPFPVIGHILFVDQDGRRCIKTITELQSTLENSEAVNYAS